MKKMFYFAIGTVIVLSAIAIIVLYNGRKISLGLTLNSKGVFEDCGKVVDEGIISKLKGCYDENRLCYVSFKNGEMHFCTYSANGEKTNYCIKKEVFNSAFEKQNEQHMINDIFCDFCYIKNNLYLLFDFTAHERMILEIDMNESTLKRKLIVESIGRSMDFSPDYKYLIFSSSGNLIKYNLENGNTSVLVENASFYSLTNDGKYYSYVQRQSGRKANGLSVELKAVVAFADTNEIVMEYIIPIKNGATTNVRDVNFSIDGTGLCITLYESRESVFGLNLNRHSRSDCIMVDIESKQQRCFKTEWGHELTSFYSYKGD